jgi:DNA replication protein DnaC
MTTAPGERLPYLLRALKAPRILDRLQATAERARTEGWPYEQFLEALCEAEVFAREASGARQRIRHAGFPAPKTLEDFDFAAQPGAERPLIGHLAQLAWIDEAANVCLIGPPGTGKTHLAKGRDHALVGQDDRRRQRSAVAACGAVRVRATQVCVTGQPVDQRLTCARWGLIGG